MNPLFVTLAQREPGYNSFMSAIEASRRSVRSIEAMKTTSLIKGSTIVSVEFTDINLKLMLNNKLNISIYLEHPVVGWSLQPVSANIGENDSNELQPKTIPLLFPNSPEPYFWSRLKVAMSLEGRELIRVCAGETWFAVDAKGQSSLMFLCLQVIPNRRLLYFDPE
jgi:hypothetical protein